MAIKLYIDTLNGFRAGELIATSLRLGFMEVCTDIEIVYNRADATHCIMYATLANNDKADLNKQLLEELPSLLLHDDLAIPNVYNARVISAFDIDFIRCMYFHSLFQRPIRSDIKRYNQVYGGTFKHQRLPSYKANIVNEPDTLLIGSDKEWDEYFPNTTRMKTIKDMEVLYTVMSQCNYTFIAIDVDEEMLGSKLPLRAIEPYMCGMTDVKPISKNQAYTLINLLKDELCKQ